MFLAVGLVDGERVARLLKLNKVISDVETGSEIAGPTRTTALNGGLTGVVTRWAVIEIPPALCPQLYCVCNTNEQLVRGGPEMKNSQSNPFRITTELGNVGPDPGQEELFWQIPKSSASKLKRMRVGAHEGS